MNNKTSAQQLEATEEGYRKRRARITRLQNWNRFQALEEIEIENSVGWTLFIAIAWTLCIVLVGLIILTVSPWF